MDRSLSAPRAVRRRYVVGRDVEVIDRSDSEVSIEGRVRLRPGACIELHDERTRLAFVHTWMVVQLGRDGPVYRGRCRWVTSDG